MDDRQQTMEPAYTISSPGAFGSAELKNVKSKVYHVENSKTRGQTV